ncbi:MAG: DUF5118 domain-containing protein, partial [Gemmatimonadales bacterium]|nr:DUF5118 domain-containing protein [Gemmatimonadales bacterium]
MTARFARLGILVLALGCRPSQPTPTPQPAQPAMRPQGGGPPGGQPTAAGAAQDSARRGPPGPGAGAGADPTPRPYRTVITGEAKSRDGLFKTHRIGSRLYFEIPRGELNREMLLVPRAARTPLNVGYGGQQTGRTYVLRWERRDHRVYLRSTSYETVADSTNPIYRAVRNSNNDLVVAAFNVEAYGPDSAAVIEVSRMYTAPPPE